MDNKDIGKYELSAYYAVITTILGKKCIKQIVIKPIYLVKGLSKTSKTFNPQMHFLKKTLFFKGENHVYYF
jgi:hypothetical protein